MSNKQAKKAKNTNNLCDGNGFQTTDRLSPMQTIQTREPERLKVLSGHPDRDHEQGDSNNNDTVTLNKHTTISGQNPTTTSAESTSCREKEDGLEKRVPGIIVQQQHHSATLFKGFNT